MKSEKLYTIFAVFVTEKMHENRFSLFISDPHSSYTFLFGLTDRYALDTLICWLLRRMDKDA